MTRRGPGQRTGISTTPRNILKSTQFTLLPGPIMIDETFSIDGANTNRTDELRAGCLMARIDSGLWVPLKYTLTATSGFSGSGSGNTGISLPVDDARFYKAGDEITLTRAEGATISTVNDTVVSVDYANNILTLTTGVDNASGGLAVVARGNIVGADKCRGILLNTVRLLTTEAYNSTEFDTQGQILNGGLVDQSQLLGDLSAVLANKTDHFLGNILFDEEQGKA